MTNTDFLSVTSPGSYWHTSRAPRYSLSFALPLLLFYQVLAEAVMLALLFGFLVGGVSNGVLGGLQILARPAGGDLDRWTRLMLSLGAGIYEELLFRVLLVGALAAAARALLGWRPLTAGV